MDLELLDVHGGSRVGQFFKVWWMFAWRFWFLTAGTGNWKFTVILPAIIAAVLIACGLTVRIFPVLNLLRFKSPLQSIGWRRRKSGPRATTPRGPYVPVPGSGSYSSAKYPPPPADVELLRGATEKGKITGFEPKELQKVTLHDAPWIIGKPGAGLASSGFGEGAIEAGQLGELNFAKSLQQADLINKFQSYWSVFLPSRTSFSRTYEYQTDVDCVLFNGKFVYLVDIKNYKGGNMTYYSSGTKLYAVDKATEKYVDVSSKMSKNMEMATELFRAHLEKKGYKVKPRVVFMPQSSGEPDIDNVYWPGRIKAVTLSELIAELQNEGGFIEKDHSFFHGGMATMVKS